MAKIEQTIDEDFDELLSKIESGILNGSSSATLEEESDFSEGIARCSVRVFERYSFFGNNRLSMSVTLFQVGDSPVHLSAVTAGGSFGLLQLDNSMGEEAFLDKLLEILGLEIFYDNENQIQYRERSIKKRGRKKWGRD